MGVNFATLVYLPSYDMFARPVTFYPYASQPGAGPYNARGIYNTQLLNVVGLDESILTDQQTILDIREIEFAVLPQQEDHVVIDQDSPDGDVPGMPALGEFEIVSASSNGGGETTLVLRKWLPPRP